MLTQQEGEQDHDDECIPAGQVDPPTDEDSVAILISTCVQSIVLCNIIHVCIHRINKYYCLQEPKGLASAALVPIQEEFIPEALAVDNVFNIHYQFVERQ